MLPSYEEVRLTEDIVNLAQKPVGMYEETTGNYKEFQPVDIEKAVEDAETMKDKVMHFVVDKMDESTLLELLFMGKKIKNIAYFVDESEGREGKITYLTWANNPKVEIRLYPKLNGVCFAHL